MDQNHPLNATTEEQPASKGKTRSCDKFKVFLIALSFSFNAKILSGIIMKSSITHIERRFDISTSLAGLIDGSFEIGNLLVIVFVSYFGSKLHRPKLIGIGCLIMGTGSILTALPHFFMGYYRYSTGNHINPSLNSTSSFSVCISSQTLSFNRTASGKGCIKESGSYMWIYVFLGNMLRGIGETPITPLGISYIDDFAKEGQSSFYLGILHAIAMIGPATGFLLGSQLAKLYVDIGFVDLSSIYITPTDSRWVGAWWLGFLIAGFFSIISSIPFFFLPKSLNKPQKERKMSISSHAPQTNKEFKLTPKLTNHEGNITGNVTDFIQSLRCILTNPLYVIYVASTLLNFSGYVGGITYIFKYIEQQFGQSLSDATFWTGVITMPTLSFGFLFGGYIIKKFKLSLVGIAQLSFTAFLTAFIIQLFHFLLFCETKSVAGLTLAYDGKRTVSSHENVPLSSCNLDCGCDQSQWEPVCGENGITYMSPCLAGCQHSRDNKKSKVFNNCSCVDITGLQNRNNSAHLGECPRSDQCKRNFYTYLALQVTVSLAYALGSTPGLMMVFKNVQPELKSLAVGFNSLIIRSLGGILAPIYIGALIDRTCLKWSLSNCGKQGSCRLYDSTLYGNHFWGTILSLKAASLILFMVFLHAMKKKYRGKDTKTESGRKFWNEANVEPLNNNGHFLSPTVEDDETHM